MNIRFLKITGVVITILLLLVAAIWGLWTWFTRQALPKTSGRLELPGLLAPVEILRDEYGVAHIYAQNPHDLFYAQGFVHAQERYWQMEFQRRVASGRLSEIFGEDTLETDIYLRHFGFSRLTAQSYDLLDEDSRLVVDAYAEGVNAYLNGRQPRQMGLEFALLQLQGVQFEIEPWSGMDAMLWAWMLIYDQSDEMETELNNAELLVRLGEERYMDTRPPYRADRPVIIPSSELSPSGPQASAPGSQPADLALVRSLFQKAEISRDQPPVLAKLGLGSIGASNSFAVSGALTNTGKPILANDPHMSVNMPALWYQVGLYCVEKSVECPYRAHGFSLPGVPGLLIGFNDRIAWGLTNASFDAEDVFIERINPANPNQYEVNGEWVEMDTRREEFLVNGREEPVVIQVRSTRNGLVVTDRMVDWAPFTYEEEGYQPYALTYAWTALQPVQSVRAVLQVVKAQNWTDFVDALQYFDAGKQNWLYADTEGNIGYVMPGKVPVRAGGDGSLPVPGWTDDYTWTGFIPYADTPQVFNPEQGFIVTANNPQVRAEDYTYLLSVYHDRGQRAQRLTELIQSDPDGVSMEDAERYQTDNKSLSAEEIIPYLKGLSFSSSEMETARNTLLNWDAQMTMDNAESALFNIFWAHLLMEIYADDLPPELIPDGDSYSSDYVADLLTRPDAMWWDDINTVDVKETRDDILVRAFEAAYRDGVERFGEELSAWRWGELHTITFRNATLGSSGISLIENIFNRGPFPTHGSESVVQKTCWDALDPYTVTCIPALRQVIDLGDLSNSRLIHSVGQSGHPMHPHYDDFIDDWRLFRYHKPNFTRAEVLAGPYDLLTLQPGP